jgi:L-cysteine/cystine lyase
VPGETTGSRYGTSMTIDGAAVRRDLPLLDSQVYLNTGGTGPMPVPVAEAIRQAVTDQLHIARMGPEGVEATDRVLAELRGAAARVVAGTGDDVAITANTTTGLDIALWGIDWAPGDHLITTELEHPGLSVPIAVVARRHGVEVTRLTRKEAEDDLEAAVARHLRSRTRVVAFSHVSWCTGAVLDVAGAVRAAARSGALVVIDGAQAVGAIPVDAHALGVDAYAFPAQKWLCGPEGLGALWIPQHARDRVDLTFCAYEAGINHRSDGQLEIYPGARRYEISTAPVVLCHGWLAGLRWLEAIGWPAIHAATAANQAAAREELSQIDQVRIITPRGPQAGLVVFDVDGYDPEPAFWGVMHSGVCLRWLVDPPALRASLGFFLSQSDIGRLGAGVRSLWS